MLGPTYCTRNLHFSFLSLLPALTPYHSDCLLLGGGGGGVHACVCVHVGSTDEAITGKISYQHHNNRCRGREFTGLEVLIPPA